MGWSWDCLRQSRNGARERHRRLAAPGAPGPGPRDRPEKHVPRDPPASTLRAVELPAGYRLRAPEPGDLDAVADVLIADSSLRAGRSCWTRASSGSEWSRAGFSLAANAWVVADGAGTIAGYVQAMAEEPGTTDCWGVVHPRHRGRGIGAALVGVTQERAARLAGGLPSGRLRHVINAGDAAAADLLRAAGLHLVRHFWHMQIDLPAQVDRGDRAGRDRNRRDRPRHGPAARQDRRRRGLRRSLGVPPGAARPVDGRPDRAGNLRPGAVAAGDETAGSPPAPSSGTSPRTAAGSTTSRCWPPAGAAGSGRPC